MPRQRRRIVLTTAVICLVLIALPFMLTWPQTQMERLNRQLIAAIRVLDADAVEAALKRRADPNTRSNPDAPSVYVQRVQRWFRRDTAIQPEADTALNEALSARFSDGSRSNEASPAKTRIIKALLEAGADVNKQYLTGSTSLISDPPLVAASRDCSLKVVQLLLDYKANVNARTNSGNTALIEAALQGRTDVVQLLLRYKAEVNAKDSTGGMTALMCAAQNDYLKTEEALIQGHADVNLKNSLGLTALKYAEKNGHPLSVQLLLKHGALK